MSTAKPQRIQTITIPHEAEPTTEHSEAPPPQGRIYFYTETVGDLYLAQGHPRLAAEVYRALSVHNHNPRLAEKLAEAERRARCPAPNPEKRKDV